MMSGAVAAFPGTGNLSAVAEVQVAAAASGSEAPASTPPAQACFLLDRLLPRADRNGIRGDIEEEFKTRLAKDGPTRAGRWQQTPVFRSVLVGGLMRLLEWIFRQIGS
jgi:hypothetical protein